MANKKTAPAAKKPRAPKAAPGTAAPVVDESVNLFGDDPAPEVPEPIPASDLCVRFRALHPDVPMPIFASAGAACFDLHSNAEAALLPGLSRSFPTGLVFEVPEGHVMLVFSRSGHGFKHGVRLVNSVGVVDSDYRGEVAVGLMNEGTEVFTVRKGDRIAQAMILPLPRVQLMMVDSLTDTERGAGGFGSTGQ